MTDDQQKLVLLRCMELHCLGDKKAKNPEMLRYLLKHSFCLDVSVESIKKAISGEERVCQTKTGTYYFVPGGKVLPEKKPVNTKITVPSVPKQRPQSGSWQRTTVLQTMQMYCNGCDNAKNKDDILRLIKQDISERAFRRAVSELKHEGLVGSTHSRGYWYCSPDTKDRTELEALKESWLEMKSRAMDMLKGCDKRLNEINSRIAMPDTMFERGNNA